RPRLDEGCPRPPKSSGRWRPRLTAAPMGPCQPLNQWPTAPGGPPSTMSSPAASSHGPRTTSDVVAAPREMDGARTIGSGSKSDTGSHDTVLNEKGGVSPSSLTNHDAPWSGSGLARAMSDYEGPRRLGTRTTPIR